MIGVVQDNIGIGIAVGLAIGAGIGEALARNAPRSDIHLAIKNIGLLPCEVGHSQKMRPTK